MLVYTIFEGEWHFYLKHERQKYRGKNDKVCFIFIIEGTVNHVMITELS